VLLSVIIPIYCKPAQFLQECLDSVWAQSFRDFELLLIDDASPDHPQTIIRPYFAKDRRIKLIHFCSNRGVAAARNCGLRLARGKYVAFVDADDLLDGAYFEHLVALAERFNLDMVTAQPHYFQETESLVPAIPYYFSGKISQIPLRRLTIQHFICRLFRRSAIASLTFDENLHAGEDILFIHRALLLAQRCMEIRYRGYFYRRPPRNYYRTVAPRAPDQSALQQRKVAETLHLVDRLCALEKIAKNTVDVQFLRYFTLRRFLRYSNHIWKLESAEVRQFYWQKFCTLFYKNFSPKMPKLSPLAVFFRWIFSREKPFWGVRAVICWARILWECRHLGQNFYRLAKNFKLIWKGYVC
jgi:glycosyltransferase involved in cell wall biosynthesis